MTVVMPVMTAAQEAGWLALLDLHRRMPTGWTLVGGQMVHLHCAERGATPTRPTNDMDAVLDVRAQPQVLYAFTTHLAALGFEPDGESWEGHQHRWMRQNAVIDVMIPTNLGQSASARAGARGGTVPETPGAQQALQRTESIEVQIGELVGAVLRPTLLGALVIKAAAYGVLGDSAKDRHVEDFVVLATLVSPRDRIQDAGPRDREYLGNVLGLLRNDPRPASRIENGPEGIERLRLRLNRV
jgi:hypothetical protein